MRFARAFRRFVVAVESQSVQRVAVAPVALDPEAGVRWGHPATFDEASRNTASDEPIGFSASWIDNYGSSGVSSRIASTTGRRPP